LISNLNFVNTKITSVSWDYSLFCKTGRQFLQAKLRVLQFYRIFVPASASHSLCTNIKSYVSVMPLLAAMSVLTQEYQHDIRANFKAQEQRQFQKLSYVTRVPKKYSERNLRSLFLGGI
jgi:ribosome-associated toxin RatA of RatAB toxin-antitoxin module